MGYTLVTGSIATSLSRHNSDKDVRHDRLWKEFIEAVRVLANNPKYREITLMINADTEDI